MEVSALAERLAAKIAALEKEAAADGQKDAADVRAKRDMIASMVCITITITITIDINVNVIIIIIFVVKLYRVMR